MIAVVTGCAPVSEPLPSPAPSIDYPPNPIDTITDPASDLFVDLAVSPVLEKTGTGPATFALPDVDSAVAFYVTCSPSVEYRIDVFDSFVSGQCGHTLQAFGSIPVSGESRAVRLSLPEETVFYIVGIQEDRSEN